jgi:mono/diheme cytochrome c family protein
MVLLASCFAFAEVSGDWFSKVPERDRVRTNPMAQEADAAAVGAKLFRQNCAACHGANAEGHGKKPSLHTERVQHASDGELFWLLTNGNMAKGMPSWSRLPEGQRWDVVSYLRKMQ